MTRKCHVRFVGKGKETDACEGAPRLPFTRPPDGSIQIVVKEPVGRGCQGLADDLAEALGQIKEKGRTQDYFRPAVQRHAHLQHR